MTKTGEFGKISKVFKKICRAVLLAQEHLLLFEQMCRKRPVLRKDRIFMLKTVLLNGQKVNYFLERKKVKNINLRIKPDQTLHVSAHTRVPVSVDEAFK